MWFQKHLDINKNVDDRAAIILPTLEDANSIQVGLCEVMRLLIHNLLDPRTAGLLLRALRTATINLKYTSLEPAHPTQVVIDPQCVAGRPLGATAWSAVEGREYDEVNSENKAPAGDSATPDTNKALLSNQPPSPEKLNPNSQGQEQEKEKEKEQEQEQEKDRDQDQAKQRPWDADVIARWRATPTPTLEAMSREGPSRD
jgi:hypothetical protein